MAGDRRKMTARVVDLRSDAAGDAHVSGTLAERLDMMAQLARVAWELAGRPFPQYVRATMPIRVTTLASQRDEY